MQQVLGVAIGVALVYLLLSIIASHVQEMVAALTAKRAATLEEAILKMVGDGKIYSEFASHPLIETISYAPARLLGVPISKATPRPTYIASPLFSRVLLSTLAEMHQLNSTDVPTVVKSLPDGSELKKKLSAIILGIEHDAVACQSAVEQWYDGTMDRVNGLYKRHTQNWLLALGMVLAIICNANLFNITQKLWTSQDARDAVTATAQMYSCKDPANCSLPRYEDARDEIQKRLGAELPIGYDWNSLQGYWKAGADPEHRGLWGIAEHWSYNLGGWLLTAIAVSLGAPFWFDLLNKLVNLRLAGQKPAKAKPAKVKSSPAADAGAPAPVPGNAPVAAADSPDQA